MEPPQSTNGKLVGIKQLAMKRSEREIIEILTGMGIIDPDYQGEVILHFSEGSLSDIDRVEKSFRRRLEKKFE